MKPGRYEIRLGAETADARSASVFVQADVPNFAGASLAVSGLVLSAAPPVPSGPHDAFKDLMPILPTTRRAFETRDRVLSFLRIYQTGTRRPLPAALAVRIVNTSGTAVMQEEIALPAEAFDRRRRADCQFELPIRGLAAGDYVLTVDVKAGDATVQRAVRFSRQ